MKNKHQINAGASGAAVEDQPLPDETQPGTEETQGTEGTEAPVEVKDPAAQLASDIENLKATGNLTEDQVKALESIALQVKNTRKTKRVASGSKPRPNVSYVLLDRPPKWSGTPQVAQIEQILFDEAVTEKFATKDPKDGNTIVRIPEPELFDLIKQGAERGILRTRQEPVRIFQYYRSELIAENVLRQQ